MYHRQISCQTELLTLLSYQDCSNMFLQTWCTDARICFHAGTPIPYQYKGKITLFPLAFLKQQHFFDRAPSLPNDYSKCRTTTGRWLLYARPDRVRLATDLRRKTKRNIELPQSSFKTYKDRKDFFSQSLELGATASLKHTSSSV